MYEHGLYLLNERLRAKNACSARLSSDLLDDLCLNFYKLTRLLLNILHKIQHGLMPNGFTVIGPKLFNFFLIAGFAVDEHACF